MKLPFSQVSKYVQRLVVMSHYDRMPIGKKCRIINFDHIFWHQISDISICWIFGKNNLDKKYEKKKHKNINLLL